MYAPFFAHFQMPVLLFDSSMNGGISLERVAC